jgi:Protein of unknown function (DUF2752)
MSASVTSTPLIYVQNQTAPKVSFPSRLLALGLSGTCLAVLCLAAYLHPSPDGFGTHTTIGLNRCEFLARTGLPCPSCGMTTSFAWFVRGNIAASLYVQPMGTLIALITAMTVWAGGYIGLTGRAAHRLLQILPGQWIVVTLMAVAIAAWGWKIFIHLHGIDGWR